MLAILFKSMAENIREITLTGKKVNEGNTGRATKINSNNDILLKNLRAMAKSKCAGCRKL